MDRSLKRVRKIMNSVIVEMEFLLKHVHMN